MVSPPPQPTPDTLHDGAVAAGRLPGIDTVLTEVCRLTGMGFAAVARVTEHRWIACMVHDGIDFGMTAGDELAVRTTICDEIRATGQAVVIDSVRLSEDWKTHPVPILYGFESYASFPIILPDGRFFGTLCALDPRPRHVEAPAVIEAMKALAMRVAAILIDGDSAPSPDPVAPAPLPG